MKQLTNLQEAMHSTACKCTTFVVYCLLIAINATPQLQNGRPILGTAGDGSYAGTFGYGWPLAFHSGSFTATFPRKRGVIMLRMLTPREFARRSSRLTMVTSRSSVVAAFGNLVSGLLIAIAAGIAFGSLWRTIPTKRRFSLSTVALCVVGLAAMSAIYGRQVRTTQVHRDSMRRRAALDKYLADQALEARDREMQEQRPPSHD